MKSKTDAIANRSFMWKYVVAPWGRLLREPAFLVCMVLLGVCAVGLRVGADRMKWHFRKLPLPLRQSLDELDVGRFGPYVVVHKAKIAHDVEEALGTTEYIQWGIRDTSLDSRDPGGVVNLFITYYTGNPDKVPHTPDQCYQGSGGVKRDSDNTTIVIPGLDAASQHEAKGDLLPVRVLDFDVRSGNDTEFRTVVYFFAVNGDFACTRDQVRFRQNNMTDKYAFFSKVEISFNKSKKLGREGALAATQKLAAGLVPALVTEYWPDWNNLPSN
jgi:hypothetical protein